jgi:hypothetical protein
MYENLASVLAFIDPRHFIACNFTAEELKASFTTPELGLVYQYACSPFHDWVSLISP